MLTQTTSQDPKNAFFPPSSLPLKLEPSEMVAFYLPSRAWRLNIFMVILHNLLQEILVCLLVSKEGGEAGEGVRGRDLFTDFHLFSIIKSALDAWDDKERQRQSHCYFISFQAHFLQPFNETASKRVYIQKDSPFGEFERFFSFYRRKHKHCEFAIFFMTTSIHSPSVTCVCEPSKDFLLFMAFLFR